MSSELAELKISPFKADPAQLVTARSYLIDRFTPECEIVSLPPRTTGGGVLRYGPRPLGAAPPRRRGFLTGVQRRDGGDIAGRTVFDFRLRHPQNWAHFLNNHLPIYFWICDALDLDWTKTLIVMPADTPDYIRDAADMFGLDILASDGDLSGDGIAFEADPWICIRAARDNWVRSAKVQAVVAQAARSGMAVPQRVFLSRRNTRTLSNEAEVVAYLAAMGFVTFYPEDLCARDQFRLFREAETIVAIHGAGLAPLLYRPSGGHLRQLIEILPCGHMTDVYRIMAQQVGCAWIGVRGKLKPAYVRPAYDFSARFDAFSRDDFEVDIQSLELAFAMATHPIGDGGDA